MQRFHELEWSVFAEQHDEIDALEGGKKIRSIGLIANRTGLALETSHRRVGVETDDQRITLAASRGEKIDMARVQEIEDTVCENDLSRQLVSAGDRVVE
jgi:hypothetical protein